MKNTIIIPARAGSKRLKNKNFLIFNDKSIMERTITFSKKIKMKGKRRDDKKWCKQQTTKTQIYI